MNNQTKEEILDVHDYFDQSGFDRTRQIHKDEYSGEIIRMAESYLPLTEYSSKYKVSISTLRRRIKADDIKYVFEDGKYLISDEPVETHQKVHRPSLSSDKTDLVAKPEVHPPKNATARAGGVATSPAPKLEASKVSAASPSSSPSASSEKSPSRAPASDSFLQTSGVTWNDEIKGLGAKEPQHIPILAAANQLLTELKKAYTQVLHEKEEQILHLKEETSDLKTLIRVLEAENERLKRDRR